METSAVDKFTTNLLWITDLVELSLRKSQPMTIPLRFISSDRAQYSIIWKPSRPSQYLLVSPCRTFHPESLYCTFKSTFQIHNFLGNWSPPPSIPRPPPLTHFFLIVSTALRREEDIWVMYVPTQVFPPAATR